MVPNLVSELPMTEICMKLCTSINYAIQIIIFKDAKAEFWRF